MTVNLIIRAQLSALPAPVSITLASVARFAFTCDVTAAADLLSHHFALRAFLEGRLLCGCTVLADKISDFLISSTFSWHGFLNDVALLTPSVDERRVEGTDVDHVHNGTKSLVVLLDDFDRGRLLAVGTNKLGWLTHKTWTHLVVPCR